MEFDKSKVYTSLNAEELEVGSEVILANYLESLKQQVEANSWPTYAKRLDAIMGTSSTNRFKSGNRTYNLAYFVRNVAKEEEQWIVYLAKEQDFSYHLDYCAESFWPWGDAKLKLFVGTHDEAKEWCQSRRKFTRVIKAWENGKTIQIQTTTWTDTSHPVWDTAYEYRVKPEENKWIVYIARYQDGLTLCCCDESYWENAKKFDGAKTKLFVGSEDEAKEWCNSRQKLTKTIRAWEDGKTIQIRCSPVDTWTECVVAPEWSCECEYRVKPDELVWTDLKMGDVLWREVDLPAPFSGRDDYVHVEERRMVTGIVDDPGTKRHVQLGGNWICDDDLKEWSVAE